MSGLLARIFHGKKAGGDSLVPPWMENPKKVDENYVSEFTSFIEGFLDQHPEVVEDQRRGWLIWWDHKIDMQAQEEAAMEREPDDGYGFHYHPRPVSGSDPSKAEGK